MNISLFFCVKCYLISETAINGNDSEGNGGESLKFKYTLLIILLTFSLLPLYILGIIMTYENDRNTEEVVTESLGAISNTQMLDINAFCEERKEYMELIRQYDAVQEEVLVSLGRKKQKGDGYHTYLEEMLKEQVRSNTFVASISVIDAEFGVVASSAPYAEGELSKLSGVDEKYWKGEFRMGQVYKREINGSAQKLVAAYEGIFYEGELIGYIVEEIQISFFNRYRDSVAQIAGGKMYILDGDGQYITAGIAKDGKATAREGQKEYEKHWNSIDWKKNPSGSFIYEADGKKYVTYYSDIDYTDWKISINEDLSLYRERTERFRRLLIAALVIISIALFMVNIYLSSRLTKPLGRIVETLSKVRKEHNYALRVGNNGKDEFGVLSKAIDELLSYAEVAETLEQRKQKSLEKEVELDPLTGIYNKKAIDKYISRLLEKEAGNNREVAVGFVDIDNFRDYNTKYGHQAGDEVICFVANTLKRQMGEGVGRNGGDEFLFCFSGAENKEQVEERLEELLRKLNEGFHNSKTDKTMPVPCSIGVAIKKAGETTQKTIIRNADEAMYQTKEKGKNNYSIL